MPRVLVIDDDETSRLLLRETLEDEGYEVEEASDGKIGVGLYRQNPTDLVITDLIMPGQEGIETILELRQDFPGIRIIAISGGGTGVSTNYLEVAKKLGARHTLTKPIKAEELLAAIRDLLGKDG